MRRMIRRVRPERPDQLVPGSRMTSGKPLDSAQNPIFERHRIRPGPAFDGPHGHPAWRIEKTCSFLPRSQIRSHKRFHGAGGLQRGLTGMTVTGSAQSSRTRFERLFMSQFAAVTWKVKPGFTPHGQAAGHPGVGGTARGVSRGPAGYLEPHRHRGFLPGAQYAMPGGAAARPARGRRERGRVDR